MELECVPNVTEGRDREVIQNLAKVIQTTPHVKLLNVHSDIDHNRSVYTFVSPSGAVWEAAFRLTELAIQWIDIRKQKRGVHPFIGAVDVIPFIPLGKFPMREAARLAETLGEHIADELNIPVYLYGEAAKLPERRNLANVRKGGFDELTQSEKIQKHPPDLGPKKFHKTAGATAVGARDFLIAYNINLATERIEIAQKIAKSIREKDGGFPGVKALGVPLPSQKIVQVTMNVTDHRSTRIDTIFQGVEDLARAENVEIKESELVGMIPEEATFPNMAGYLKLKNFSEAQILRI